MYFNIASGFLSLKMRFWRINRIAERESSWESVSVSFRREVSAGIRMCLQVGLLCILSAGVLYINKKNRRN